MKKRGTIVVLFIVLSLMLLLRLASAQEVFPQIESFQAPSISIPIITGMALLDSINPCVIGVLILLLTILLKTGNKRAILVNGAAYTIGVYITYLIGGVTLLGIFNVIREIVFISQILYFVVGAFIIIAGLIEVKDFFWYGKWYSLAIPASLVHKVEKKAASAHTSLFATFSFGALLTLIELPCTGAPYLAVLTLMSQSGYAYVTAFPLLLFYNLVFVLPLIAIIWLAYSGFGLKRLEGWRKEHRGQMRLYIGLMLLGIGIWIITAVAEYLLAPLIIGITLLMIIAAVMKYAFRI